MQDNTKIQRMLLCTLIKYNNEYEKDTNYVPHKLVPDYNVTYNNSHNFDYDAPVLTLQINVMPSNIELIEVMIRLKLTTHTIQLGKLHVYDYDMESMNGGGS